MTAGTLTARRRVVAGSGVALLLIGIGYVSVSSGPSGHEEKPVAAGRSSHERPIESRAENYADGKSATERVDVTPGPAVPVSAPGSSPARSGPDGDARSVRDGTAPEVEDLPSIDVVRIDAAGAGIVAGQAAPGAKVVLRLDGREVAATVVEPGGGFVSFFDVELGSAPKVLSVEAQVATGPILTAGEGVIVAPAGSEPPDIAPTLQSPPIARSSGKIATNEPERPTASASSAGRELAEATVGEVAAVRSPPAFPITGQDAASILRPSGTGMDATSGEAGGGETKVGEASPSPRPRASRPGDMASRGAAAPSVRTTASASPGEPMSPTAPDASAGGRSDAFAAPSDPAEPDPDTPAPAAAAPASSAPQLPPELSHAVEPVAPRPPRLYRIGAAGVTAIDGGRAPSTREELGIDAISYDAAGEVRITGHAAPDETLRIYLDGAPVLDAQAGPDGAWSSPLRGVDTGVYTLRIDAVAPDGTVTERVETPFQRTAPEIAAAARRAGATAITVQPGFTLWAISVGYFGTGMRYVQLFEANRGLIRDPDLIYPGQVFALPAVPSD